MHNLDFNIKSPQIKQADDAHVDSLIDNEVEVTESNMGRLVSRMNSCN